MIYRQSAPESQAEEVRRESESVSNAAMASYVFEHYARMLRYAPSPGSAASAIAAQDAVNPRGAAARRRPRPMERQVVQAALAGAGCRMGRRRPDVA